MRGPRLARVARSQVAPERDVLQDVWLAELPADVVVEVAAVDDYIDGLMNRENREAEGPRAAGQIPMRIDRNHRRGFGELLPGDAAGLGCISWLLTPVRRPDAPLVDVFRAHRLSPCTCSRSRSGSPLRQSGQGHSQVWYMPACSSLTCGSQRYGRPDARKAR